MDSTPQAPTMRDLMKSALTLPWAISMFGVQQITSLAAPPSSERLADATAAFDAVSDVTAQQLDGWLKQTYKIGTGVQRLLVDLMMFRTPEFDQSTLMHMAAEMQDGPGVPGGRQIRPAAGRLARLVPRRRDATRRPSRRSSPTSSRSSCSSPTCTPSSGLHDANTVDSLQVLVDKVAAMRDLPARVGDRGAGQLVRRRGDQAQAAGGPDPTGLLTDPQYASLPPWSMTMLHAGHRHVVREGDPGRSRADELGRRRSRPRSRAS